MTQVTVDVIVERHGSIIMIQPMTGEARQWLTQMTGDDAIWYAGALAVDIRFAEPLIEAMNEDGFYIE
jgi:hypothetical protein